MGKRKGRDITGIMLLNKAPGCSSNQALQQLKRLVNAAKAGHTGTLDPMASGLLPVCLGQATKISQFLLNADKAYQAVIQLGARTTTGDIEGEVVRRTPMPALTTEHWQQAAETLCGTITQVPPRYSALKKNGKPLYEYARQGIDIEVPSRQVRVDACTVLAYDSSAQQLHIAVKCGKGTYIRTLAEDLCAKLKVDGYLCRLHRTCCGPFTSEGMRTLEGWQRLLAADSLETAMLPVETAFAEVERLDLTAQTYRILRHQGRWQPVDRSGPGYSGLKRLYYNNQFVGIAWFERGTLTRKQWFDATEQL